MALERLDSDFACLVRFPCWIFQKNQRIASSGQNPRNERLAILVCFSLFLCVCWFLSASVFVFCEESGNLKNYDSSDFEQHLLVDCVFSESSKHRMLGASLRKGTRRNYKRLYAVGNELFRGNPRKPYIPPCPP